MLISSVFLKPLNFPQALLLESNLFLTAISRASCASVRSSLEVVMPLLSTVLPDVTRLATAGKGK